MTTTEWAYDVAETVPAQLITTSAEEIERQVGEATGTARNPSVWSSMSVEDQNAYDVRPVTRIHGAPDAWSVRDATADVHAYIGVMPAQSYQITLGYRPMTYEEARQKAKRDLLAYYRAYRNSQFTAAQVTFDVTNDSTLLWMRDMLSTIRDRELTRTPVYHPPTVIDIDGEPHTVPDEASWHQFYDKFEKLSQDGADIARQAWVDIRSSTTRDEVIAIMDALPPIPGTV